VYAPSSSSARRQRGNVTDIETAMYSHVVALFPICRSITGPGLRETLHYIRRETGASVNEVPTATAVLDWEVPNEWTVRGATIRRASGEVVVDFANHNLHLVQYSRPLDTEVSREELERHLHSIPEQPDLIPYRTAYYADTWGFCLTHRQRETLTDPAYHVRIDTLLLPGSLSYGELLLRGDSEEEVLFSVHCCHPSLANDNLSSIAVAIELAKRLAAKTGLRYSYRFVFIPGTIGAITWLHFNRNACSRIKHGLVLSCLGDSGLPTYKQSRRGNAMIDCYVEYALQARGLNNRVRPFVPYGYDERQYCSPGFDLPVGCLMRSQNGTFPEYHTSADNLDFVRPHALADSLALLENIIKLVESDRYPINASPFGEPQLGRRGLYAAIGGQPNAPGSGARFDQLALLWVLNQADGSNSLLDIAERSGKPFDEILAAANALEEAGLLHD
jgi:aminopeptidase-like protein